MFFHFLPPSHYIFWWFDINLPLLCIFSTNERELLEELSFLGNTTGSRSKSRPRTHSSSRWFLYYFWLISVLFFFFQQSIQTIYGILNLKKHAILLMDKFLVGNESTVDDLWTVMFTFCRRKYQSSCSSKCWKSNGNSCRTNWTIRRPKWHMEKIKGHCQVVIFSC